jgi:hypothetical protein
MATQTPDIVVKDQLPSSPQSSDDPRSLLDDDLLNRRGLTNDQYVILNELLKLRTATLSRFEIKTDRIGQGVEKELAQLEKAGWVKSEKVDGGLEPKVYYVSAKAFQLLRFPKKNQILSV